MTDETTAAPTPQPDPDPEPGPVESLPELADAVARMDERLGALEDAADTTTEAPAVTPNDELARLAWAVKHGRQRPW
jgi:hypothetical protein